MRQVLFSHMDKVRNLISAIKTGALRRHTAFVSVGILLLFVTFVRFHLRQMPLERDEGEYAYVAQMLLAGKLPYEHVHSMKLPGVSVAYALALFVFGDSAASVRALLWIVNTLSIVLVFILGRRLLDTTAGAVAAAGFGLVSLSPSVLGLAAHATHFVMLFVLAGLWFLLRGVDSGRLSTLALSGVMFGIAFMMKQPGLVFGLFALAYLWFSRLDPEIFVPRSLRRHRYSLPPKRGVSRLLNVPPVTLLRETGSFTLGLVAPFAITCLLFLVAGAFGKFWFWTFTYAAKYGSIVSFGQSIRVLYSMLKQVAVGNLFWGILGGIGLGMLRWDRRIRQYRVFLIGFLLSSIVALWVGMYFRHHYFVLVLPAVTLLAGVAVSRAWYLLGRVVSIELLLTPIILLLLLAALLYGPVIHAQVWFAKTPAHASEAIYRSSVFVDSVEVANYLREVTPVTNKIAVLGSEPQIYFYSRRQAATGYIYMYPLMEPHRYAARMQDELIRQLESEQPEHVVFVNMHTSWLRRPESERKIFDWWNAYSKTNYVLVRIFAPSKEGRMRDPEKFLPYFLGDNSVPTQFLMRSIQPDETVPLAIHVYKKRNNSG